MQWYEKNGIDLCVLTQTPQSILLIENQVTHQYVESGPTYENKAPHLSFVCVKKCIEIRVNAR